MITTPNLQKTVTIDHLNSVWRRAYQALVDAKTLVIVGYSFRDADYDILQLLRSSILQSGMLRIIVFDNETIASHIANLFNRTAGCRLEVKVIQLGYLTTHNVKDLYSVL